MKKVFVLLLAVLALSVPRALAQEDNMMFNHLSLGISVGLDGIGAEVVLPASPFLQDRGGYSYEPIPFKRNVDLGKISMKEKNVNLSNIPLSANLWKGGLGNLMLDIYLSKTGSFHFVAGAFAGSGKLVGGKIDARNAINREDYKTAIEYHGVSCSTDGEGFVYADATVWKVLPYVGVGFGRALDPAKRVNFSFELGAAVTGGVKLVTYDFSNPAKVTTSVLTSSALVTDSGKQLDKGWVDKLGKFPVLPMMKFGVYVNLF